MMVGSPKNNKYFEYEIKEEKKMKRLIYEDFFGMTDINPLKASLPVHIWSEHDGIDMPKRHSDPRLKIGIHDPSNGVEVSIDPFPKILVKNRNITKSDMNDIKIGIEYVGRNYDLFLKHFNDRSNIFDDEDLFNALRQRGEYR